GRWGRSGQAIGVREVVGRGDILVSCPADEGDERVEEARGVPERSVSVEGEVEEVLAQEDDLLGTREDGRSVRETRLERMVAQQPIAPGMEGADHRIGEA